jgi:hypothetical protein
MWIVAFLRRAHAVPAVACFILFAAAGCQAILGIDDTSFQNGDADSGAADGSTDALTDALPPNDSGTDAEPSNRTVTFSPTHVFLNQGHEVDVTVNLARNGFTGDATLALASVGDGGVTVDGGADGGGADGIGATTLTIPRGSNTGILHLFASGTADLGPTTFDFTLTAGTASVATLPALVGGPPGSVDTTFGINGVSAVVNGFNPVSIAIGDDDSIWVLNGGWHVLHYFADGTSDDTLNTTLGTTLGAPSGTASRIAVRGAVVLICGTDGTSPTLRKLTTTGSYDPTFASAGIFQPKKGSNTADGNFTGVAFGNAGDILLSAVVSGPTTNIGGVVYRLRGGVQDTFVIGIPFTPVGVGVDPSGHIGTGGQHVTVDGGLNLFGQVIDDTFQDAGLASIGNPANGYTAQKTVVTSASQISIAATRNLFLPTGSVAAFSTTDGTNVFLSEQSHTGTWDHGYVSIAAQSDGKVLVTNDDGPSGGERTFVARMDTTGGVDSSWSFSAGAPMGNPMIVFNDLAVDSVGRVIAAGFNDTGLYLTRAWP